ncbi:MAG: kinase [bacterium]|nr:kinase [bacterium]
MIITRTPLRISFFGGGTDYPTWYKVHGGAVLSTSIDKYLYINCRHRPPFFEHKSRIVWSQIENVKHHEEIKHPAVRGVLQYLRVDDGVEIHYDADLPARTGLGSSSAFTVGLLHALRGLKGTLVTKRDLATTAIHIEQNIIKESVGSQDQIATAYGGFNKIEFFGDNNFRVTPVTVNRARLKELRSNLMLIFTGFSRTASEIAVEQIKETSRRERELHIMRGMVDQAIEILHSNRSLNTFGELLHESWQLKRGLSSKITTPAIDELYERARSAGAIGGKILGAGGGGFFLLFASPERQPMIRDALRGFLEVPFEFENTGSHIAFYNPGNNNEPL